MPVGSARLGALPRQPRLSPQQGSPLKRTPCTLSKLQARCTHKTDVTHKTVEIRLAVSNYSERNMQVRIALQQADFNPKKRYIRGAPFYPNVVSAPCLAASLCSYHRKIISHSDGHSVVNGKTKKAVTQTSKIGGSVALASK